MRALILRKIAIASVHEARAAWRRARDEPVEANVRGSYRACVLAARALLRASEVNPDDEEAMIEEALLIREVAQTALIKLVTKWPDAGASESAFEIAVPSSAPVAPVAPAAPAAGAQQAISAPTTGTSSTANDTRCSHCRRQPLQHDQ